MNKKITLGLAISLIAIASAVTFILTSFFSLQSFNEKIVDVNEKAEKYENLEVLDNYVREQYFGDIDEKKLNSGILKGYVNGLEDKYSRYLTAEEYQEELTEDSGERVGLGITVAEDESGYMLITEILENSPLSDSDIKVNDIIVAINDIDVLKDGFDEAVNEMRGNEGTEVTITVRRGGTDIKKTFTRTAIEVITVNGEMLDNYVGYIKVSGFKKNTPDQFISELEELIANGAKAFIFDVRVNGGGLVSALEECIDPLLPEGVIANAVYSDEHEETIVYSDESELDLPMVVLVNGNTASAAELFAASLKDFEKAKLVGEQTYGKGVMQVTSKLDDGSAVVLTVAEYKTVKSECYDKIGITPDYIVESDDENSNTDLQLNKAIEVIKKWNEN